jgi:type IV secretion system protein VirD4
MWRLGAIRMVVVWAIIGNCVVGLGLWLLGLRSETIHPFLGNLLLIVATGLGAAFGYFAWLGGTAREPPTMHGSAAFGETRKARATLGGARGLIVGRAPEHWLMRYDGPAHLLTLAPTRSGKGVGVIIPNMLTIDRSVICVDPKGENARITARARAGFGPVHVLDPFGASGEPTSAFNPLAALDPASLDIAEDAALIAEALVYDPPNQVGEAHWNEEAKALIAGIILYVVTTAPLEDRTLGAVRDLLTTAPDRFEATLKDMQRNPGAGGLVARAANRHLGKSEREATGVLSSAQRHTHFLDSPRMVAALGRSDFAFRDLRDGVVSVFLVLPPDRLAAYARWLRLLVTQALNELARAGGSGGGDDGRVLFLLDEFAALGRLEPIERAYGLMAGYGVQLWAILQDLHQLKATYGERAGTFMSNAGVIQVFNVADIDTASWVSRTLGVSTEAFYTSGSTESSGSSWGGQGGSSQSSAGTSSTLNYAKRDLLTPDEVMRLPDHVMILLRPGRSPLLVSKVRYYAENEFQGLFDA